MKKLLLTCLLLPTLASASNVNVIVNTNAIPATIERNTLTSIYTHHFVQIDNHDSVGRDFDLLYYHCVGGQGCWAIQKAIRIKAHENYVEDLDYPQNIMFDCSGNHTITAMTKVQGKAIRNFVKIDKAMLTVK